MKIEKLRTDHLKNPVGYQLGEPCLSWIVTEARGERAVKARVQIGMDAELTQLVFDSGERSDIDALGYAPPLKLAEATRYYWRVRVWDDAGDCADSDTAYFETAAVLAQGTWITAPFDANVHPLFRRRFELSKPVASARLYISGLGVYEAWLNGKKVGDEYLAPFCNDYNLWTQYQTYDITQQLQTGSNAIGVMLGNGWYKGRFGFVDKMGELYGSSFQLICELHMTYADGSTQMICSDESWLCAPSPVLESSIYDGEVWDSRRQIPGWAEPACDETGFVPAVRAPSPLGALTPRLSPPVRVMQTVEPVGLIHTPAAEQVVDFGQNMTGWVEFTCREPAGTEIVFQFGEILQNDNFYNENLRTAKQEYRYVADGKVTRVRPHFTFYGFRYMKVCGISDLHLDDFTGCVIYSDMDVCGRITTSNPKVNRLFENALWGQKGNFLDVPTDCPQRDERMGWTGDAQVFCATACYNMYTPAFYRKFLYDMKLEQDTLEGAVPHVVPDVLGQIDRILHKHDKKSGNVAVSTAHSSCAWADAATVIPWTVYEAYGDKTMLRAQYGNMKAWTDHIRSVDVNKCGGRYLWADGFHFADWLALDNYHRGSSYGASDPYYIASAYYYYSASLTAKAARVLGIVDDAAYYEDLAVHIKSAIQDEYFTKTGRLAVDTQTALVLALRFDLVPDEFRQRLIKRLQEKLEEEGNHLTTGFVGTPFLCPVLTECGLSQTAYTLLCNEDYPSWLYEVNMGATTIWERWNSVLPDGSISDTGMNSLNHYSYGSIVEWMYRYMCGVRVTAPGFRRFMVKPYVDARFDWAQMEYDSAVGRIESGWCRTADGYTFHVVVPFDAEASFVVTLDCREVSINGVLQPGAGKNSQLSLAKGEYNIDIVC